ncbi:hypothetical protein SAMN02745136_01941 [Anaerocolumna jejuensis DSM 15929]|uniref:Uncharacterized protein n=1 Tax=Anaerocolumna jejuensis DSM 15929 TaxID=1121322 RepID=A0A1M6QM98_9FIRM|nr:hypothetical protein [Anaerocolumna jejuensis]SHK21295.1 hypothetical protein SAMN02745136_01941 [Anaerocolumna jejuensis DSM 15929]
MEERKFEQITRCEAITNLIDSIAKEEEAIAKVLKAIDEKHPHPCEKEKDDDELKLINALARLEFLITSKLYLFIDCACPKDGCEDKERPWPR